MRHLVPSLRTLAGGSGAAAGVLMGSGGPRLVPFPAGRVVLGATDSGLDRAWVANLDLFFGRVFLFLLTVGLGSLEPIYDDLVGLTQLSSVGLTQSSAESRDFPGLHLASAIWSHGDGLRNGWLMVYQPFSAFAEVFGEDSHMSSRV